MQGGDAVVGIGIDVGAVLDQDSGDFRRIADGGPVQRRVPLAGAGVDVGPVVEQHPDDLHGARVGGPVQRRGAVFRAGADVGALRDEQARRFDLAIDRGPMQGGGPAGGRLVDNLGRIGLEQFLHALDVAGLGGFEEVRIRPRLPRGQQRQHDHDDSCVGSHHNGPLTRFLDFPCLL